MLRPLTYTAHGAHTIHAALPAHTVQRLQNDFSNRYNMRTFVFYSSRDKSTVLFDTKKYVFREKMHSSLSPTYLFIIQLRVLTSSWMHGHNTAGADTDTVLTVLKRHCYYPRPINEYLRRAIYAWQRPSIGRRRLHTKNNYNIPNSPSTAHLLFSVQAGVPVSCSFWYFAATAITVPPLSLQLTKNIQSPTVYCKNIFATPCLAWSIVSAITAHFNVRWLSNMPFFSTSN